MIKIEELTLILTQAGVTDSKVKKAIIQEAEKLEADKKADKEAESGPKAKNRFVICVRGDDKLKEVLQAGYIMKVPENSDNNTILERIQKSSAEQNNSGKRKKKVNINKYSEFFAYSKRKHTKAADLQPITKEVVEVIVLPSEDIDFGK